MKRALHQALKPLAWLEGTWRTENLGSGKYPTIKDFSYYEEISFTSVGQPMFNYTAQSYSDSSLEKPMHRETGFLKITGTNEVILISAHNFGLTVMERGEVNDKTMNLTSTNITRVKEAKKPHVKEIRREFKFDNNCLEYVVYMATSNTPELTEHLRAKFVKVVSGEA